MDEKPTYEITIEGTGIREYYEFDKQLTENEVKEIWFQDVQQRDEMRGRIVRRMKNKIRVEKVAEGSQGRQEHRQVNRLEGQVVEDLLAESGLR